MSANNAFSLLNEAEGSDTSYRTIHVSYRIRLTPEMAWSETLKEDFAVENENVVFWRVRLYLVGRGGSRREEARNCGREGASKESQEGQETSKEGRGKGRRLRCYYKRNGSRESNLCRFVMCSPRGCWRGEESSCGQTKRIHFMYVCVISRPPRRLLRPPNQRLPRSSRMKPPSEETPKRRARSNRIKRSSIHQLTRVNSLFVWNETNNPDRYVYIELASFGFPVDFDQRIVHFLHFVVSLDRRDRLHVGEALGENDVLIFHDSHRVSQAINEYYPLRRTE